MLKRLFATSLFAVLLLITPLTTALAGSEENGGGTLMEGPFIILAFATLIIMAYYCFRD
ncbi:MAG: hypothetical protein LRY73_11985 [Bacillus sp. (in: Bacteria)]|nr:hypothetical protein [Bacillus sp. (in: firmicutes)]